MTNTKYFSQGELESVIKAYVYYYGILNKRPLRCSVYTDTLEESFIVHIEGWHVSEDVTLDFLEGSTSEIDDIGLYIPREMRKIKCILDKVIYGVTL